MSSLWKQLAAAAIMRECGERADHIRACRQPCGAQGRLVLHGAIGSILVIYDRGRVFAHDNRCPHIGFPLERAPAQRLLKL
jgi:nitrite reductase/ring-hydroxylating ferredoxin subunit